MMLCCNIAVFRMLEQAILGNIVSSHISGAREPENGQERVPGGAAAYPFVSVA